MGQRIARRRTVALPLRFCRPFFFGIPFCPRAQSATGACGIFFPCLALALAGGLDSAAYAATPVNSPSPATGDSAKAETIFIDEYQVDGAGLLPRLSIEEAVYPFLGPGRTAADVESARAALEQVYHDRGFQTVAVQIPAQAPQNVQRGVIHLEVLERPVGRLRVKGARYSSPSRLKAMSPSLAEGGVIDFTKVSGDVVALNQLPDRQVTPSLHAGAEPDTVDVDLDVKEQAPLHASAELNNRRGPNTTPLRLSGSVSANNLWQAGQGAGISFQVSPQDLSQVKVFSGYYLARFAGADWLTLLASGTKQDSNVSTLGDTAVAGRGTTLGLRTMFSLPGEKDFTQTASVGLSYKHFDQDIHLPASGSTAATDVVTPITYYPIDASYTASWQGKQSTTEATAGLTFHVRGVGSDTAQFGNNRFQADGNFLYFHGELTRTQTLPAKFQLTGKLQGQIADQPLLSGEQASGGGEGTVRGYLESEAVGDSALFASLELRSPSLLGAMASHKADWWLFAFSDAGWLKVIDPLPDQKNHFDFLSFGIGSRWRIADHFDGSIAASLPQLQVGTTRAREVRITFKAAVDY